MRWQFELFRDNVLKHEIRDFTSMLSYAFPTLSWKRCQKRPQKARLDNSKTSGVFARTVLYAVPPHADGGATNAAGMHRSRLDRQRPTGAVEL